MITRTLTADKSGPAVIDLTLTGHGGTITVRAERDCDRATLTVRTADQSGPAADAVRQAALRQDGAALRADVQGAGTGCATVITGGGTTIVQSAGTVTGSMTGLVIGAGDVIVNGYRVSGGGATVIAGSSPIEITAVVPKGSTVIGRTQSADITVTGTAKAITADTQSGDVRADTVGHLIADTQSGDVRIGQATDITAATMSGDVTVTDLSGTARVKTMSGDVRIHATGGGDVTTSTMSGDIDITATRAAIDRGLTVRTGTMSGRVRTPNR
ncbi:DUF4097 family beta strand repeat-containing protein [Actinomadura viridis]|uniref:DUF4097 family beta strand repeat-containing protein n=1 Tax=Actinomadura viridis TaxID=58110 RepID=UPI0036B9D04A